MGNALGDGGSADGTACQRVSERRLEGVRADLIEQAQHAGRLTGERLAPEGEGVEEGVGVLAALAEPVPAAEVVGAALLGDEPGEMPVADPNLLRTSRTLVWGSTGWSWHI
jgi:hypothetical protein